MKKVSLTLVAILTAIPMLTLATEKTKTIEEVVASLSAEEMAVARCSKCHEWEPMVAVIEKNRETFNKLVVNGVKRDMTNMDENYAKALEAMKKAKEEKSTAK